MFSTFNFEEPPKTELEQKIGRKDRRARYLRALSAKNNDREPSTSSALEPARVEVEEIRNATLDVPAPFPDTGEPSSSASLPQSTAIPTASDARRHSRWATVREKSPQMIAREKSRKLDLNRGSADMERGERKNEPEEQQKSFSDVVKTAMMLRNWISSMEHDERESEPDRDPTVTNCVESAAHTTSNRSVPFLQEVTAQDDQRAILGSQPTFETRSSGFAMLKSFCTDKWHQIRYFYCNQSSPFFYYWTCVIAAGILWNMFAMVIFIFDDVHQGYFSTWLRVNIFFDVCFLLDCVVSSRMTFVHEGHEVMQTEKMLKNYKRSQRFKLDLLCLAPLDLILFAYTHLSLLRAVRMIKAYRLYEFVILTQRRTDFPHFMKVFFLMTSCCMLFHWNACIYFFFSLFEGLSEDDTNAFGFSYYKVFDPRIPTCSVWDLNCTYPEDTESTLDLNAARLKYMQEMYQFWEEKHNLVVMGNFSREYSMTMYWSSLTITKCGQQPWPSTSAQNALEIFDTLIGVLVFATIIGSVGNVITQMSKNVNDFRQKMDGIKFYMNYRGVQSAIQQRVISCFMYLNVHNQLDDEKEILSVLPPRFQASIAANLHSETLSKVSLFENCDPRFLLEVVMLVKQQVYSPNDYLCRKNEKAKEMFIVKKGTLSVIDDDSGIEVTTLSEGSTFGELSIVHVKGNLLGDRRSVSVRSVGYSDIYVLHQDDVTRLLQEYPEDRVFLMENARKMLHSRDLLEKNELGEMCDNSDDFEDEGVLEFLSVDEQLDRLTRIVDAIDTELTHMITSFSHTSVYFKQRVTALENVYNSNKKRIRADLYNGILLTDYDYSDI